jgi:hypothetical protein
MTIMWLVVIASILTGQFAAYKLASWWGWVLYTVSTLLVIIICNSGGH